MLKNNNYEPKTVVFDNMYFSVKENPLKLHFLFKDIKHIAIIILNGTYYIKFRNQTIAYISNNNLTLIPGFFIHRVEEVFKTYNRLIKYFAEGNKFVKFINSKWVVCENID